jgi:hypothetical protein
MKVASSLVFSRVNDVFVPRANSARTLAGKTKFQTIRVFNFYGRNSAIPNSFSESAAIG